MVKLLIVIALCATYALALPANHIKSVAEACNDERCKIEDGCRCSSAKSPLLEGTAPQLISLTFDEAIVTDLYDSRWKPLLYDRLNPDKQPIGATFFVPHEYTDYQLVNNIYNSGFEIGVHSITKDNLQEYWRTASLETLTKEFNGQKQIINTFAGVPLEDIRGVRTPQLQIQGNVTFQAYQASGLTYDSSWSTLPNQPLYPYTLDYSSTQQCDNSIICPNESFKGFWVNPIVDLHGETKECNTLASCVQDNTTSVGDIKTWLLNEINDVRSSSRVPLTLLVNAKWFSDVPASWQALTEVLDEVLAFGDTFLVSQKQIHDWTINPVTLENFQTDFPDHNARCKKNTCKLINNRNEETLFKSCSACPAKYPWLDNPLGQ